MAGITIRGLSKNFGASAEVAAVSDITLDIADNSFVTLLGPSGCGKTTTLRMVAGLEQITSGEIAIGDRVVNHLPSKDRDVDIVFEHPGEATFPVSCLVVKRGGMVVFCAGTTGYNLTFDARYVWMRQKRIQGSHFAHLKQASAANQFVLDRRVDPCLSKVFTWDKIPAAHQIMWKNQHPPGNMAVLVNAPRQGCRTLEDAMEPAYE